MTVRADYDPSYFRRFLWMAFCCAAAGGWFFFDGSVTYPRQLERCTAFWQPTGDPGKPWKAINDDQWKEISKANGWSAAKPEITPDKQRDKIGTQFFHGICGILIAIPCLLKWFLARGSLLEVPCSRFLARGSWIEGDRNGIESSWGKGFSFDQVDSMNNQRWEEKGIAKVQYTKDGHSKTFVLDDFKYKAEPMGRIIRWLEARLTDDQIMGEQREPVTTQIESGDDSVPENQCVEHVEADDYSAD